MVGEEYEHLRADRALIGRIQEKAQKDNTIVNTYIFKHLPPR
jgi:hypothetical protein